MTTDIDQHNQFLELALAEAQKCEPVTTAFCVGCVITSRWPSRNTEPVVISCGYSRELTGNTHAEANALAKVKNITPTALASLFPSAPPPVRLEDILASSDCYTTLEPCSVRTSGLSPCADALIAAKINRCFIGVGEPADFVNCEGAQKLKDAGIEVVWLKGFEERCLKEARRGHENS